MNRNRTTATAMPLSVQRLESSTGAAVGMSTTVVHATVVACSAQHYAFWPRSAKLYVVQPSPARSCAAQLSLPRSLLLTRLQLELMLGGRLAGPRNLDHVIPPCEVRASRSIEQGRHPKAFRAQILA